LSTGAETHCEKLWSVL